MHASGTFDVKLAPQPAAPGIEPAQLGRMTIDKQFQGDLQASSLGEMLSAGTVVTGSAGYVAIERISGALHGRQGSFVLMHFGLMDRGTPSMRVTVVPDSGTGELAGIRGELTIRIERGQHEYGFDYELP
ncbi:MAG: DUF3224 domain-containing protein [Frateuria sp.]|uniref:DUF3224 domain-containing protein n=1 Tax=Frateuria sp. TaxID=2211372 RepID=UPI0017CCB27F|nr:DUF3224 domain-containing protein [Frateuria sp.]NUO73143.1 DUF3224 domain-containing protein [Frateuria sp.]NUR22136.1 DUF3224 domain-containing protein [Frateuria sp.]